MTIQQLRNYLEENNISKTACQVLPPYVQEGSLCLLKDDDSWLIQLNERGKDIVFKKFYDENSACRYFFLHAISEPTNRNGFQQSDLFEHKERSNKILLKYGYSNLEIQEVM